jgi:hypothetical protein
MMRRSGPFANCYAHHSARFGRIDVRRVLVGVCANVLITGAVPATVASAQPPSMDSLPPGRSVAIRPLYGDDQILRVLLSDVSGFRMERVRQVIHDQPSWELFWSRARVSSARKVPPPVDFDRDMIIAASDSQSLFGPDISILDAVARADSLYVLVRSRTGVVPGCRENAYAHPMAIALVPKSDETVVFVNIDRKEWCGHPPPS